MLIWLDRNSYSHHINMNIHISLTKSTTNSYIHQRKRSRSRQGQTFSLLYFKHHLNAYCVSKEGMRRGVGEGWTNAQHAVSWGAVSVRSLSVLVRWLLPHTDPKQKQQANRDPPFRSLLVFMNQHRDRFMNRPAAVTLCACDEGSPRRWSTAW